MKKVLRVFGLIIFIVSLILSFSAISFIISSLKPGEEIIAQDWYFFLILFSLIIGLGYLFRKTLLTPFKALKINQKQKLILAIFVPVIILFVTLIITNNVGYTATTRTVTLPEDSIFRKLRASATSTYIHYEENPFDWDRTWYIWFLALIFCCIFEYKLFADKNKDKEGG
jgi:hypothetical protein